MRFLHALPLGAASLTFGAASQPIPDLACLSQWWPGFALNRLEFWPGVASQTAVSQVLPASSTVPMCWCAQAVCPTGAFPLANIRHTFSVRRGDTFRKEVSPLRILSIA